ncbi:calcium-activated chloride channel regulator 4A-like [Mercenaria mercenaria]|uniref:calcium-activated chloride channel regulator 4A-like n=1 Tax=Mercenaria mercenaria TaxID=6596 RepID=UPI00234F05E0|nr:calcium-activated chloride channel regulator 4A-like [Mercenaria mercenaria]
MIYFRKIRIVVPKSWSVKPEYKRIPVPSITKQYIIVDKEVTIKTPHVRGLKRCGGEGIYMYLNSQDFILKKGFTKWGMHDHVIVHEWGHLRWGLFDEYPKSSKFTFYQEKDKWNPVKCTKQITGVIGKGPGCKLPSQDCNTYDTGKKMNKNCKFCPNLLQSVSASLMGFSYLNAITMFCDKDEVSVDEAQRHNRHAPNLQNLHCGHKSAWEVMRRHKDFKDAAALLPSTSTTPFFEIIQSSDVYRVFVLDVSGSMKQQEKLKILRQTGEYVIHEVIRQGSWLGIVTFNSLASTVKQITQINSKSDRDELIAALPSSADDATCIGCGMEEAIRILTLQLGNAENTELVVISDGLNNRGNIQASTQKAIREKVIVHTIAVTQEADTVLADIAKDTGGKHYTYLDTGTISFAATFSETIQGDLTSTLSQHAMLVSEKIDSTPSYTLKFDFTIEEGLGANTSVTVISRSIHVMTLELTGPKNYTQTLNTSGTYATLLIPDVAQAGKYEMKILMQERQQTIEYYVKSSPTNDDIVEISSWLSSSKINISSGELPVAFVDVRKGYASLVEAIVEIQVESDNRTCKLNLKDNGNDPDIISNDGVYSGYIFPECLSSGRVSIKVYASGQEGKTKRLKQVFGAPVLAEVEDDPETLNSSFQRVQIMEELFVTEYKDTDTADVITPGRITDVDIYNIVKKTNQYGESRNFTLSWTATGDDKNIGQASSYIMRISDDFDILLNSFDTAELLDMKNYSFIPKEAGLTEALTFVVNAEQMYTETTFFAIQAVDEAGNKGAVSNIVSIVVAKGYRAVGEPGSLDIDTEEANSVMAVVEDAKVAAIAGGSVGGVILLLISFVVVYICRKRQLKNLLTNIKMGSV